MEGQSVHFGMLASPGVICDIDLESYWRCKVIDENLNTVQGDLVEESTLEMLWRKAPCTDGPRA